jgi:HSP20 family molecular chaperone IbpA
MTKLTNYNSNPTTYRTTTSLIDAFFNRDPFEHPFFWGDVSRTGDTVRFKEGDELTVEVDLPGVSKDKTTVSVEGRVVSIEGVRKVIHKGGSQEETFSRSFKKMAFLLWYFLKTKWKTVARRLSILVNRSAN